MGESSKDVAIRRVLSVFRVGATRVAVGLWAGNGHVFAETAAGSEIFAMDWRWKRQDAGIAGEVVLYMADGVNVGEDARSRVNAGGRKGKD